MSDGVHVCAATDLPPGERTVVEVNGREVGVLNVDGDYFALSNTCPHQGGPVCEGKVTREITGDFTGLGERVEKRYTDTRTIACPWHGWEYDLETGEHVGYRRIAIPTFDVIERDGELYLDV